MVYFGGSRLEQFERLSVLPRFAGFFGSRSTVAGASGVAQLLRKLYVLSIESRVRGLRLSDFTLSQTHEISPVVLNLGWKGLKYGEVLNCTVSEAARHFQAIPRLGVRLITLDRLGLGYLSLSQPVRTLSTGEQQRIRLAVELASGRTGNALFLLDEPTRGLSAGETALLVTLFRDLVRRGHTVVCIEHEPELLAQADYLIEFGPGGGPSGGQIIAEGSPDAFKAHGDSVIGRFL
jgi:excinuclease ABC subunit A